VVSIRQYPDGTALASAVFPSQINDLSWHPNGEWVGATDASGFVHVIDAQSGEYRTLGQHKAEAATVTFSPDGAYLVSGGWDRELICWDLRRMERALSSFYGKFRPDGREFVVITKSSCLFHSFELPTAHRQLTE